MPVYRLDFAGVFEGLPGRVCSLGICVEAETEEGAEDAGRQFCAGVSFIPMVCTEMSVVRHGGGPVD